MSHNSRFAVAVHVLTLMAGRPGEAVTSESLAGSVNTNPVVVRRVLGLLRTAGHVTSQGGNGGGWRLTTDPASVTLRSVYRAVETDALFALHHRRPNTACPVGRRIQGPLRECFSAAAVAMEAELERTTIAGMLREVQAHGG